MGQDRCCGVGTCVLLVPDVFDQCDEDGIVVLLDAQPPAELYSFVQQAVSACPAAAVVVTE
ncbi:ferredoxin [Kutzneria buriramensis]|uniref:ferredoxin n=1 Tax=Kutzneria buriramensis TaxID=1045776 RepID=UPI0035F0F8C9